MYTFVDTHSNYYCDVNYCNEKKLPGAFTFLDKKTANISQVNLLRMHNLIRIRFKKNLQFHKNNKKCTVWKKTQRIL